MKFEIDNLYTRADVQNLLDVPEDQRGGNWDTGYNKYAGQLYVFCNVGTVGRTGHDHENAWDGDTLIWVAKAATHIAQPLMQEIVRGELPLHIFSRNDSSKAQFNYHGEAQVASVEETTPVRFRLRFTTKSEKTFQLGDLLTSQSKLFAKSEFAPVHSAWPALSFSSRKVASDFASGYVKGRDYILFVGTGDAQKTADPEHRRRVLSLVAIEPNALIATKDLVAQSEWDKAVQKWGVRWEWSLPVLQAFDFSPLLEARNLIPRTYSRLGELKSLGRAIEVESDDLAALFAAQIVAKPLVISKSGRRTDGLNEPDRELRQEFSRLAFRIQDQIAKSETTQLGTHPKRSGPNLSDIMIGLRSAWQAQEGICFLCERRIPVAPANKLLQMSPDRLESSIKSYDFENVRLTHLGCNLAKNKYDLSDWQEFLTILREPANTAPSGVASY